MAAPYASQAITGYNSNPPADDGSAVSTNQIKWSGVKTKIGDPIKTRTDSMDSALVTAFTKTLGGGAITSISTDYTVQASDQGKLIKATASLALTMGDATAFTAPFSHGFVNLSGVSITVSGGGGQTIDGNASFTVAAGAGFLAFTDGANWNTNGLQGTFVGKQLMYGDIINGTIVESNTTNAVTFSLKTLAGNTPSATDPILLCFRNSTLGTGNYVYRSITAATTLTISSGSTMGAVNSTAFRLWLTVFDDGGTMRIGAINCVSGTNIYPLGRAPRASSTAEGGAGAADSAQTFYTGTAVTNKAYVVLGYANYESGLATAGSWNVSPDVLQLYGPGVSLPGVTIQVQQNFTGAEASGTTVIPEDDTIPQITEGDQYMTQAITPTSAANLLRIESLAHIFSSTSSNAIAALFQDTTANALAATWVTSGQASSIAGTRLIWAMLAGTTSATTFRVRGGASGGTTTFNGVGAVRKLGGVMNSYMTVTEVMA